MTSLEKFGDTSLEQKNKEKDKKDFVRAAMARPDSLLDSKAEFLIRFGGGEIDEFEKITRQIQEEDEAEKEN